MHFGAVIILQKSVCPGLTHEIWNCALLGTEHII